MIWARRWLAGCPKRRHEVHERGVAPDQVLALGIRAANRVSLERDGEGGIGKVGCVRRASAPQHRGPAAPCLVRQLRDYSRLPDARLPAEEDQAPLAGMRSRELLAQLLKHL